MQTKFNSLFFYIPEWSIILSNVEKISIEISDLSYRIGSQNVDTILASANMAIYSKGIMDMISYTEVTGMMCL